MVMLLSFCDLITEATPVLSQPGVWHLNFGAWPVLPTCLLLISTQEGNAQALC